MYTLECYNVGTHAAFNKTACTGDSSRRGETWVVVGPHIITCMVYFQLKTDGIFSPSRHIRHQM